MNYFVTGATGFIGRHLLAELLKREGTIYVLVREGSRGKIDALVQRLGAEEGRIVPVTGDLSKPGLGIEGFSEPIDHFFHLAAIYDMAADDDAMEKANIEGTQHVIEFANSIEVGRFHHTSSIAVAGRYKGVFQEDMFDEGQTLPHAYHRTKYESERLVREGVEAKTLVYRPGIVVGHSETGEMDKIDGPYYYFKLLPAAAARAAGVGAARRPAGRRDEHRAGRLRRQGDGPHRPHADDELPSDTFHLVNPEPMKVGETLNEFAKAAHAPQFAMRVDPNMTNAIPPAVRAGVMALPTVKRIRHQVYHDLGHPAGGRREPRLPLQVRRARHPARAQRHRHRGAAAVDLRPAPVGLLGAQPRPGPVPRALAGQLDPGQEDPDHRRVERHRPRDGAQDRRGRRRGAARLAHAREARGGGQAGRGGGRHRARPPGRPVRPRGHRPARAGGARRARRGRHPDQQRRPLDPALGGALLRPLPRLRAHHAAELLRRAQADHGVPARHARAQDRPHHQRVVDRRADQHAALLRVRRLEGGAGRVLALRGARVRGRQRQVHDGLHAAGAHADDRADRHVQGVPHALARRGGRRCSRTR